VHNLRRPPAPRPPHPRPAPPAGPGHAVLRRAQTMIFTPGRPDAPRTHGCWHAKRPIAVLRPAVRVSVSSLREVNRAKIAVGCCRHPGNWEKERAGGTKRRVQRRRLLQNSIAQDRDASIVDRPGRRRRFVAGRGHPGLARRQYSPDAPIAPSPEQLSVCRRNRTTGNATTDTGYRPLAHPIAEIARTSSPAAASTFSEHTVYRFTSRRTVKASARRKAHNRSKHCAHHLSDLIQCRR